MQGDTGCAARLRKILTALIGFASGMPLLCGTAPAIAASLEQPAGDARAECPAGDAALTFACGVPHAEDLVAIEGSDWIVASSMLDRGRGLYLIHRDTREVRLALDATAGGSPAPGLACRPALGKLRTHGLVIQHHDRGQRLLAVNHEGGETIEMFDIQLDKDRPRLRWTGCISLPAGMTGNSVVAKRDGTIYFSDTSSRFSKAERLEALLRGEPSGRIVEWRDGRFRIIEGLDLHGPSGTALSPDERTLFVTSYASRQIWRVDLTERTPPRSITVSFSPDNLRSDGRRIIAAGQVADLREQLTCLGRPGRPAYCSNKWGIAVIDPASFETREHLMQSTIFGDVTGALPVGDSYWLGSVGEPDRIAITRLP